MQIFISLKQSMFVMMAIMPYMYKEIKYERIL